MERFIQFNDEVVDSFLFMQLSDLAKTLTQNPEIEVEYGPHSYANKKENVIYVSHFWNHRSASDTWNGYESDVLLRAIGSFQYVDEHDVKHFVQMIAKTTIPSFIKQLFVLAEDLRIEELIKRERPGTKKVFAVRRSILRQYFHTQLNVNIVKSLHTDALFNYLFLLLNADAPLEPTSINEELDPAMPFILQTALRFFETTSTKETIQVCTLLLDVLDELLVKDMLNEYVHLPDLTNWFNDDEEIFQDIKRKDPLANDDSLEEKKTGEEEILDEEFRTWHRETSDLGTSFLQFDLEQGSKTELMGEGAREGDEGDQALGMVQGSAKKTSRTDFADIQAEQMKKEWHKGGHEARYGKENRFAMPVFDVIHPPHYDHIKDYKEKQARIAPLRKKLTHMIEQTLEHKKVQPRSDLQAGRLNKKLLRFFLEEQPRLFYKKQEPSTEIDAVFTLLVDCSASMQDKMEETKLGIVLFHEALKSVKVPHEIIGFWEDTNEATDAYQPNHFQPVINYRTSLLSRSGPEILQLQPEEDNRDGFAIRVITEKLLQRGEKQKFLLVFSDGEPAAYDYDRNGIIDTHEAVLSARKQGIEVINVFLANQEIEEAQRKTIQNMYGKYSLFVSAIDELPAILFPILKKLLYKSIN
ncbi:hypothetical protein [Bacillus sp. REN10]|uniref:vWA domain-containing protein n=1 Tax=Bacillus sp. REN10 TaxID=2782541 RepID=UPI00193B2516|nr:hypothetical protein [Bacillus sp. REN10]